MVDSGVRVKISYKESNILDENIIQHDKNDIKELISILRETQQKTNECLTRLAEETDSVSLVEEKSDILEDDSEDDDDNENNLDKVLAAADIYEADVSPKRAKLKN